ncbi:MAG TPA: heavy metal translocating P-type ATPase [Acidimicrobiales bacterium]|jgi:P-type Cu+ transporter|nr:heavy metal translocating P-type ATPase [Acidimicrobiales bacterium]
MSTSATDNVSNRLELALGGMTCASCAARIEKRLNKLEGVEASVNYALERAAVTFDPSVTPEQLLGAVEAIGYTASIVEDAAPAHEDVRTESPHAERDGDRDAVLRAMRTRLVVSSVLTAPVLVLAMIPALQFDSWQWLSFALAGPVVAWGGWPFHRAAWLNLKHAAATMDTLISVGTLAAFGWSAWALFIGEAGDPTMRMTFDLAPSVGAGANEVYLEVATVVVSFILAGRYFEMKARRNAGAALRALLELGAKDVAVIREGNEVRIAIEQLQVGDRFVVRPGEKVATDGIVEDGSSAIDASLLTGESIPVEVGPGDAVTGATVNAGGRLVVRATRVGADTALAQIARLVTEAQAGKASVQRVADRVSAVFVPVVVALAVGTLGWWLANGATASSAFTAAVAVLITACPCALGLATPTALLVGTGRGAQLGILIKGPEVLESTRKVDTIVLDKTGTVTTGQMTLVDVVTAPGVARADVLRYVGSVEDASEHPIARAIAAGARDELGQLADVESFEAIQGLGVQGVVEGHAVVAGRKAFLADWALHVDGPLADAMVAAEARGQTPIVAGWDGEVRAVLVVADAVKPASAEAVALFRRLGLHPVLLTGDNERAARAVASSVGIDQVIAEVMPEDKVDVVRNLQDDGAVVAMVGDGVNDAAALAQADLGLAMGTGTDAAIEASDLTLVRGDLRAAADAIRLSRRTLATINGNLFWAFAYNVAALPLAATGFLNPMIAGVAMALSSVFVVSNSLRLKRFKTAA